MQARGGAPDTKKDLPQTIVQQCEPRRWWWWLKRKTYSMNKIEGFEKKKGDCTSNLIPFGLKIAP